MAHLTIDLQEGFQGDKVELRIDGRLIYSEDSVTTRNQIGLAGRCEADVNEGTVVVDMHMPGKHLHVTRQVNTSEDVFIGATVDASNGLLLIEQHQEFWYA